MLSLHFITQQIHSFTHNLVHIVDFFALRSNKLLNIHIIIIIRYGNYFHSENALSPIIFIGSFCLHGIRAGFGHFSHKLTSCSSCFTFTVVKQTKKISQKLLFISSVENKFLGFSFDYEALSLFGRAVNHLLMHPSQKVNAQVVETRTSRYRGNGGCRRKPTRAEISR